jgi:hypothetical protein
LLFFPSPSTRCRKEQPAKVALFSFSFHPLLAQTFCNFFLVLSFSSVIIRSCHLLHLFITVR